MFKDEFDRRYQTTKEFEEWWGDYYGPPDVYLDTPSEQDDYWTRKAFAFEGWLARMGDKRGKLIPDAPLSLRLNFKRLVP